MSRCKRHVFIPSLVWLLLSSSAAAQVSTFDLSGAVADASGALLPGATVTLQNTRTGLSRQSTTDAEGRYSFFALPVVGQWTVRVEMQGFTTEERTGLVFQANSKPTISFALTLASLRESLTVEAHAPIVETQKAELSLTVDQQKIELMPLNGRNYLDLALFSPGVNPAAQRGDLSVNGQLGRNIEYVVDGVSNKVIEWGDASKTGLSIDVIQEFQVISSQFSAEFGHALGGVVSAVTKSGTNDFHGTGYYYLRPGDLDAKNHLTGTRAPFEQNQYGGLLSGPVFRNRMHFIGSYERTDQESQLVVTSALMPGAFPATFDRHQGFVKVTNQLSNNHSSQVRFNYDGRKTIGGFGGLTLPDGGSQQNRDTWEVQGTLTSVLSPRRVNELRFQVSNFVNESTNLTDQPRSVYTGFATFGANPSNPQDIVEDRLQFVDKLSMDFGAHRPSVGADISRIAKTGVFNANAVGVYTFNAGAAYPFNPSNPASFPARFEQGFTDPRRPISLHRDFPPFDFAGIDRQYLESVVLRAGRLAGRARADPQSRAALREADVQPRQQQHHAAHRLRLGRGRGRSHRGSRRIRTVLRSAVRQHPEHRGPLRHRRELLDHAHADRQSRHLSGLSEHPRRATDEPRHPAGTDRDARSWRGGSGRADRHPTATR